MTKAHGIVLIFDEVLSGFRTGIGGAQAYYGVTPDMTTLAKALANGAPISATVGSAEVMGAIRPGGAVHSGTYSGNLFGVLASLATLGVLRAAGNLSDTERQRRLVLRRTARRLRPRGLARPRAGDRRALRPLLRR